MVSPCCSMSPFTGTKPSSLLVVAGGVPCAQTAPTPPSSTIASSSPCMSFFISVIQSGVFRRQVQLVDARARPLERHAHPEQRKEQDVEGQHADQKRHGQARS